MYDKSFLATIGLQYFNNGFNTIITLAYMYRFLNYYELSPSRTSQYTALISLPWSPKIAYGFITDTFPIFGSRKRNYIILMGFLQGVALGICWFDIPNEVLFVSLLVLTALTGAIMDVVVDGLMVVQQRRDPNSGSEDLQTYCWAMVGLGGIIGSLGGGYLTEAGIESWCFAAKSLLGFVIMGVAMTMDKSLEKDPSELINASLWARSKANMRDVWRGTTRTPELYRSLLYFIIMGCCIPNFSDFLYYY